MVRNHDVDGDFLPGRSLLLVRETTDLRLVHAVVSMVPGEQCAEEFFTLGEVRSHEAALLRREIKGVDIPPGELIQNAYLQFQADETPAAVNDTATTPPATPFPIPQVTTGSSLARTSWPQPKTSANRSST
jgi:hypothetical protein